MPIYAYRCETCGHAKDVLQKISDPVLDTCPACGAATFRKQLTSAGFQLKGSGWYVTDFPRWRRCQGQARRRGCGRQGRPGGPGWRGGQAGRGDGCRRSTGRHGGVCRRQAGRCGPASPPPAASS